MNCRNFWKTRTVHTQKNVIGAAKRIFLDYCEPKVLILRTYPTVEGGNSMFLLFVKSLLLFNINYLNMLNVSIHSYLVPYPVYFGMIKQLITT
jgi:hypothetical protein